MNQRTMIGCMMLLCVWSAAALAQNTLGELLDAGGKKMSKAEIMNAVSGAQVSGPTTAGGTSSYDFKADGSYSGNGQGSRGKAWGLIGTWTVDDSGKVCTEYTLSGAGGKDTYCYFYFVASNEYYWSESDSDRGSRIVKRTIKK